MLRTSMRWLGVIGAFSLAMSQAQASPVSYDFSGTLAQPFDGASTFSGTLVYNTDLPTYPGINASPGWAYYSAVPADTAPVSSLTFQIGNTPSSSFGNVNNLEVIVAHTSANDAFFIQESFSGSNLDAEFGIGNDDLVQRGPLTSLNPPPQLSLASFSTGSNLTVFGQTPDGQTVNIVGTVTSLTPSGGQVPEPSTALIFGALGAGLAGYRRATSRRRSMV